MIFLLLSTALANEPAYFHPDDIASQSQIFRGFAQDSGPRFPQLQADLNTSGSAVGDLDLSVMLLGTRAPSDLQEHRDQARRQLAHHYLVAQAHVDTFLSDSEQTFNTALERILTEMQSAYTLSECTASSGLAALGPGRMAGGSAGDCEGEDINGKAAELLDADGVLSAEGASMLAIEWPETTLPSLTTPAAALVEQSGGDPDQYVYVSALAEAFLGEQLEALTMDLERTLASMDSELQGSDEEKAAALPRAEEAHEHYETAVAGLGNILFEAMERPLRRFLDDEVLGLCGNPSVLGGCPGEDKTAEIIDLLRENSRFRRALR